MCERRHRTADIGNWDFETSAFDFIFQWVVAFSLVNSFPVWVKTLHSWRYTEKFLKEEKKLHLHALKSLDGVNQVSRNQKRYPKMCLPLFHKIFRAEIKSIDLIGFFPLKTSSNSDMKGGKKTGLEMTGKSMTKTREGSNDATNCCYLTHIALFTQGTWFTELRRKWWWDEGGKQSFFDS